ncbi:hypothetical protein IFM89_002055 [Coptis chinensis]|uniref:DUF4283 domain-containing protein n=1 Tax=Coptis chinensis TaxID=261450 RepID=A0A835LTR6_9MAGN|nr:hypothetical protein IFM89_002055 [Coptis chinensis]
MIDDKDLFYFKFFNKEDRQIVIDHGPLFLAGRIFVVRSWSPKNENTPVIITEDKDQTKGDKQGDQDTLNTQGMEGLNYEKAQDDIQEEAQVGTQRNRAESSVVVTTPVRSTIMPTVNALVQNNVVQNNALVPYVCQKVDTETNHVSDEEIVSTAMVIHSSHGQTPIS